MHVLSCLTKSMSRAVRPRLEYEIEFGDLQDKKDLDELEETQPRPSRCCVRGEAATAWFNLGEEKGGGWIVQSQTLLRHVWRKDER